MFKSNLRNWYIGNPSSRVLFWEKNFNWSLFARPEFIVIFPGQFCPRGKGVVGLTLCEAVTYERVRPQSLGSPAALNEQCIGSYTSHRVKGLYSSPEKTWKSNHLHFLLSYFKDGAYYCYCAYVLRISRYSDFLSPMLTNTGIFLRGLKLSGESRS